MNASSDSKRPASDLSAPPAAGSLRVDDLSVQLVFEVGQLDLPVDQVRTLREGYAFELPGVAEQVVTIRANGREIGRGELVEINDKLGVRITTWWVS